MDDLNASLEARIEKRRAGRIATAPESFKGIMRASWSKKCAPRAAIKAFCGECNGFDRQAVADCTAFACPLWNFRPYQHRSKEA